MQRTASIYLLLKVVLMVPAMQLSVVASGIGEQRVVLQVDDPLRAQDRERSWYDGNVVAATALMVKVPPPLPYRPLFEQFV